MLANGIGIGGVLSSNNASIKVEDRLGYKSDKLQITMASETTMFDIPTKGKNLNYAIEGVPMGQFTVDSAQITISTSGNKLVISANAADMTKELKAPRTKSFNDKKLSEILEEKAGDNGLKLKISDFYKNTKIAHIDQTNESDLNFITRLGDKYDAIAKFANGKLLFLKRGDMNGAMPVFIHRSDMTSVTFDVTDRNEFKAVKAFYQKSSENKRKFEKVGDGEPIFEMEGDFANKGEAKDAAQAKFDAMRRKGKTLKANMPINANIAAGSPVLIFGVHPAINGIMYVTQSTHVVAKAKTTSIICELMNDS